MANSKLVSTKYLLRLRSQEEWEGWHFRAKAHFRKSGAWRLISEGHPRDTGTRIQVELPDYRERVLVQHRNLRRIYAGQPDLAKVWRQELQNPSRARATRRRAPSPSQSLFSLLRRRVGGVLFALFLLLFSGLREPQGHAKLGPSWRGCDRTGPTGASPIGPGPTERDPVPGRDSTWDPLNTH